MGEKLPNNWTELELEKLYSHVIGGDWGKDPLTVTDNDFIKVLCIRGGEIKNWQRDKGSTASIRAIKKSSLENRKLQIGDILLEISGGGPDQPVGRTLYIDEDVFTNYPELPKVCTNFLRLVRIVDVVNKQYINLYLQYFYKSGKVIDYQGGSNNLRNLKFKDYSTIPIPLPPLAEQNRIVEKLDGLFGHLEQIKIKLDKVPTLLKAFRQAVLNQAVTGKLTEEWREGRELENIFTDSSKTTMRKPTFSVPENWKWLPFDVVATIKSNLVDPNKYLEFPLIAPDNIQSETGRLINKPLVSDIMPKSSKHYFNNGAIVYSKIRPYLSKLIIADFDGLCSADMYPIESKIDIKYLFFYMLSEIFLSYATTAGERTVLPKINQKGVNIIPVPVPALEEQQEIVKRVKSLFAKADKIEKQYQTLKEKIDTLPQALLAKAFKGELVEQLPTDGDARELLEQIRQAKAGLSKSGKTETKRSKSKKLKADEELDVAAEPKGRYGK